MRGKLFFIFVSSFVLFGFLEGCGSSQPETATLSGRVRLERYRQYYGNDKLNLWFTADPNGDSLHPFSFGVDGTTLLPMFDIELVDLRKGYKHSGAQLVKEWSEQGSEATKDSMIELEYQGQDNNKNSPLQRGKFNVPLLSPSCCYGLTIINIPSGEQWGGDSLYQMFRKEVDSAQYSGGKVQVQSGALSSSTVVRNGKFEFPDLRPAERAYSVVIIDPASNTVIGGDSLLTLEEGNNKIEFYVRSLTDTLRQQGKKKESGPPSTIIHE
ncbi:MAG: hypothetical protein EPO24_11210 [Bacteroidetes bacterium]|nr:MAG: hypothetical protein EPO24_11210 [Bacteroidota bacterium]